MGNSSSADNVAAVLADGLSQAGTRTIFGVSGGGANLDWLGAAADHGIEFHLLHSETAASISAGVCGLVSGSLGAAIGTRGPGVTNAANGIAQCLLDHEPMAYLSDAVPDDGGERISHQLVDHQAILAPVTKVSARVTSANAGSLVSTVLSIATEPLPGPVHLDVSSEGADRVIVGRRDKRYVSGPGGRSLAAQALSAARHPVALVGGLAAGFADAVREFVQFASMPALTTYRGKGIVPDEWELCAGHVTGATVEAELLMSADLVVAIGVDPVEMLPGPWPYPAPTISVSERRVPLGYFGSALEIVGDARETLLTLLPHVASSWANGVAAASRQRMTDAVTVAVPGLAPHTVVNELVALAPRDSPVTVDAGAHMLVAMNYWPATSAHQVLISNGLATMGYALPAAIGLSVADGNNRRVVCITGDGGLSMCLAELETLARLGSNVIVCVFNDSQLSLIAAKQRPSGHGGTAAVKYDEIDFAKVGAGMGISTFTASTDAELAAAVKLAFESTAPALIDARIDPSGYPTILRRLRG